MDRMHRSLSRRAQEDRVWLDVCFDVARLGTCARRQVGCVLLNARGHVLATGRNGVAAGEIHCVDVPCPGAGLPSGTGLSVCDAIHAEVNAIAQCRDVWDIDTIYCTDSPCVDCVKLLRNTSARRIVFARLYPHSESEGKWLSSRPGRTWEHVTQTGETAG